MTKIQTSNYWIDNHTIEGCVKLLLSWLDDYTRGVVVQNENYVAEMITEFYDSYGNFWDYMDDIYVEYETFDDGEGNFWFMNFKAEIEETSEHL